LALIVSQLERDEAIIFIIAPYDAAGAKKFSPAYHRYAGVPVFALDH
jgi:hypothetical protein